MQKIQEIYEFKIVEQDGYWYVLHCGAQSGRMRTKQMADEYVKIHYEQAKEQFGEKYEVILKVL
jgi:hypothetical protein